MESGDRHLAMVDVDVDVDVEIDDADVAPAVTDGTRRSMQGNKGRNTKPELTLRSLLHRAGYRFRIHDRRLPGTPDIVFGVRRKVVCLHGCFWHRHPGCRHATLPKTRAEFWSAKFARNVERDAEQQAALARMGWDSLVVWECELGDTPKLLEKTSGFLGPVQHVPPGPS